MSPRAASTRKSKANTQGPTPSSKTQLAKRSGRARKPADEDEELEDAAIADSKAVAPCIIWNVKRTDRLVEWLENNVEDRQQLFSGLAQDTKGENRRRRMTKNVKTSFHIKMAEYIFLADEDARVRDDLKAHGAKRYAKAVENHITSLKGKYQEINIELGNTWSRSTVEQIRNNPALNDVLDQLILHHKLPVWDRLHGFWRMLLIFNPYVVSSEPGQDLEGEARRLLFPSRGNGNASEEEEPEDDIVEQEVEDASLLGITDGAAGVMDVEVEVGLEGFDNDTPDKFGCEYHGRSPSAEPFQATLAKARPTLCVAVGGYGAEGAIFVLHKKAILSGHSRTPLASTGSSIGRNSRKTSSKRSRVDSSLDSVSDQTQLAEIGSSEFEMAHLEAKRVKMRLKHEHELNRQRVAHQERVMVIKKQMQERELAHRKRMMQHELELARLKAGQSSVAAGTHPVSLGREGHLTTAYPSNFYQDSFDFGSGTTGSSILPSLPPAAWGSSEAPAS